MAGIHDQNVEPSELRRARAPPGSRSRPHPRGPPASPAPRLARRQPLSRAPSSTSGRRPQIAIGTRLFAKPRCAGEAEPFAGGGDQRNLSCEPRSMTMSGHRAPGPAREARVTTAKSAISIASSGLWLPFWLRTNSISVGTPVPAKTAASWPAPQAISQRGTPVCSIAVPKTSSSFAVHHRRRATGQRTEIDLDAMRRAQPPRRSLCTRSRICVERRLRCGCARRSTVARRRKSC